MLLTGSKRIFRLFVICAFINCALSQSYDGGEYDDDDHSSYEAESDGPDYSKYYANDAGSSGETAAALIDVKPNPGFVNPSEFSSFFSPSFYAASNKQEVTKDPQASVNGFVNHNDFQAGFADFRASPFGGKDFFEQAAAAQQQQQKSRDEYELKPGPSYVSHKIVPPAPKAPNKSYANLETEIDDLNKPYSYEKEKDEPVVPLYSGLKEKVEPKYTPQYAPKNPNNLTPYQKYSFQTPPQKLHTFASSPSNAKSTYTNPNLYNPTVNNDFKLAATNVHSKLQDFNNFKPSELIKECRKVNKHVAGTSKNSKPMDCYVCKDAKGISYEECFYGQTSDSNPKNFYIETSKQYSEPTQVKGVTFNRYKRYTVNDKDSKDDPYEYLKKQSEKYYNSPDFDSAYRHPKSYEDDYRHGGEADKSSSEQIADQLLKSGENCRKVDKDGMTCTICENKKTGGNYEQCSYTTAPAEKKYAYSKQRKYKQDEPVEETESSEDQPIANTKPQTFHPTKKEAPKKQKQRSRGVRPRSEEDSDEVERIKPVNTNRKVSEYTVPKHFANIEVENDEDQPNEEYYYLVPRQETSEETKREEQRQPAEATEEEEEPEAQYGYYGEESKKDVEEVLAEFAKKDRSKCKKAEKNGMTCYLCVDKKGLQHEECMYVSESRPQSKYQAYHAQKETDGREVDAAPANVKKQQNQEDAEESKVKSVLASRSEPYQAESKYPEFGESTTEGNSNLKKRRPKKSVSERDFDKTQNKRKLIKSKKDYSAKLEDSPVEESKDEYRVGGEKGAFSHETEPVFSKKFGVSLPKFMLEKSEGERVYDELVHSKS